MLVRRVVRRRLPSDLRPSREKKNRSLALPRTKKRQSAGVSHRSGGLEAARPRHIGRSAPAVCQPHARSHGSSARTPAWPRGAGSSVQLQRVKGGEDGEEVVGSSRRRRSQCSSSWVMVWSGSTSVVVDPRMTEGRSWRPSWCSSPGGAVCARLCWVHLLIKHYGRGKILECHCLSRVLKIERSGKRIFSECCTHERIILGEEMLSRVPQRSWHSVKSSTRQMPSSPSATLGEDRHSAKKHVT